MRERQLNSVLVMQSSLLVTSRRKSRRDCLTNCVIYQSSCCAVLVRMVFALGEFSGEQLLIFCILSWYLTSEMFTFSNMEWRARLWQDCRARKSANDLTSAGRSALGSPFAASWWKRNRISASWGTSPWLVRILAARSLNWSIVMQAVLILERTLGLTLIGKMKCSNGTCLMRRPSCFIKQIMRQPPLEHCNHCPLAIKLMDACPITPFLELDPKAIVSDPELLYELVMVLASLVPWLFAVFLFYKLVTKRDLRYLVRTLTHLLAHITCDVVKVVYFKEDRPDGSCSLKYGLPSCHSIFAGLYTTWILMETFVFHMKFKPGHMVAIFAMSFVPYSRIYLIYHTLKQCLYGWSIGTVFAILGTTATQIIRKKKKKVKQ